MDLYKKGSVLVIGLAIAAFLTVGLGTSFVLMSQSEPEEVSMVESDNATDTEEMMIDEPVTSLEEDNQEDMKILNEVKNTLTNAVNKVVPEKPSEVNSEVESTSAVDSGEREVIVLAGGCFWCSEAFFQETPGVIDAVSGYAGGKADTADYKSVSSGQTEHREAVQVIFDPKRIDLEKILDVYWSHIDPTDAGGQFADRGSQYETAIFYNDEKQKMVAEDSRQRLANSGLFDKPIATEILPFTTFFPAEEYHQDYYQKAADHYNRYKKASGREGFVEENWAKEAALYFLSQEGKTESYESDKTNETSVWTPKIYSNEEIITMQKKLDPAAYKVVAENGTEKAFENEYWDNHEEGIYVDVVTGDPLFSSTHKYDSNTGWPSFYQSITGAPVVEKPDTSHGMTRTEVRGQGGHLGHIFTDGPKEHGGNRYCINSAALRFVPKDEMAAAGYQDYLYLFGE